jgi:hypothetical protein
MGMIRDSLRFKCVCSNPTDAFKFLGFLARKWEVVKLDVEKFLQPKEW